MENDHDYVASGSGSGSSPVNFIRSRRNIMRLTTQGLSNSDHNYVFAPAASTSSSSSNGSGSNITFSGSGNSRAADEDLFLDDDYEDDDGGLSTATGPSDVVSSQRSSVDNGAQSEDRANPVNFPTEESNGSTGTDPSDVSNAASRVPTIETESGMMLSKCG